MERRHRLPPENRPGAVGPQLRDSGRATCGPPRRGHRTSARDSAGPRAGRAVARRTSVAERYADRSAPSAWFVPDAGSRSNSRCVGRGRRRSAHAARRTQPAGRLEEAVMSSSRARSVSCLLLSLLAWSGCLRSPARDPGVVVVGVVSRPNNLDPSIGKDYVSQYAQQLIFSALMRVDEHLKVVPDAAERLDNPEPTVYVATLRKGVRFHDGHELTAADVVYTFRSIFDPKLPTPYRGALRMLKSVDARDRYTVVFTLTQPFGSFPVNLVFPMIVPDAPSLSFNPQPV